MLVQLSPADSDSTLYGGGAAPTPSDHETVHGEGEATAGAAIDDDETPAAMSAAVANDAPTRCMGHPSTGRAEFLHRYAGGHGPRS
jgi:hypothetical protein